MNSETSNRIDFIEREMLQTMPTVEIIKHLTELERSIQLAMLKYDKYKLELIRRFPNAEFCEIDIKTKTR